MGMLMGVIDLGTNSVRFDVHQISDSREATLLHREKLMVRLGENLFTGGKLDRNAVRRTLQAFSSFQHTAADLKVEKIVAFGTSALREAADGDSLLKGIRRAVGIDVRVIPGHEEARLIAAGVLANEKGLKGDFALVDIGGGSTEVSLIREGKITFCRSFQLGTARLHQLFLRASPPLRSRGEGPGPIKCLRRHIRRMLKDELGSRKRVQVPRIIGSSGTVKALMRLCRKDNGAKEIGREHLGKLIKRMSTMTTAELAKLPGMEPKRVDFILAGAILLEECMDALGAKRVTFTEYALRDGILQREVQLLELQKRLHSEVDLAPLYAHAARFGESERSLHRQVQLAETLFERLKPLHRMGPRWLIYLKLAVLFRNAGRIISPIDHERHSYYIVKNVDLPVYEEWETQFVAELCLHHEGGKIDSMAVEFLGDGPETERQRRCFTKLLAILRIVDALDPSRHRRVSPKRVRIDPRSVRLFLSRGEKTELALLKLQRKKDLFERVFARPLVAVTSRAQ
jgi:exopolyphosphatase/guanosine-5'-triphosphate,3'-diphosphate pyrophosphatase